LIDHAGIRWSSTWHSPILLVGLLRHAKRQSLAAGKSRIESALERRRSLGAFDHDQVIVLALEAGCGKVCGAGPQQQPVATAI
jgi:hypothetical protein